ncbi:MAG: helix-turn-helix transcriptional regulator [SAR202 cluster bacterium]|nr:helix-turn-helix transcriptional regulator [SAR202 cluster bacterium]MDP6301325.1 helix-turn-helix transcriptional regulator [SAR202 cluster bacterium]MDP7104915.1 helix-turn-helix transcriptional regulator [SAR202 cluster bacterium]MDP7226510.1 helix-turn-helix transcriptional regulator [SAR202 cluster bacterium]MDP7414862.1 helix-turn-helix transcriptional regulator [SAR202 cluster bacterium]
MTFGQAIAAARKELGVSQRELALKVLKEDGAPISPQYLNDIERDRRNPPGDHLLAQFARELELDEDYLYFLAGKFPSDVRSGTPNPKRVKEAFKAFRHTLRGNR